MRESEKTIQSIFNIWFFNFQNPSLQQFSNLYHSTIALLKFFNDDNKYDDKMQELRNFFFHPIEKLKSRYPEFKINTKLTEWNIAHLEAIYFRDSHFRLKIGKEYYIDSSKIQETKKILLADMITLLSLFKLELFKVMIEILIENKLNIYIALPATKEIEQLQGRDIE